MSEAIESSKGDITAVVASNDGTAGGAIQALEEHKLAGKFWSPVRTLILRPSFAFLMGLRQ